MTLFEYLAIAFGLLFSLTALRLIGGLPAALDRDRAYWVHVTLVVTMLVASASAFWTFWSLSDVDWTFPRFALTLGMPSVMYFNAAALVPADPNDVPEWKSYYFEVRKRFYGGVAVWALIAAAATTLNLGMPWNHPARITQIIVGTLGIVGVVSANPKVHAPLAIVFAALTLLVATTVGATPGWLVG